MSVIISFPAVSSEDPSQDDLAAIEREWPLIAAELDLLDSEISYLNAGQDASELDHRRIRRAQHRVLEVVRELADRSPKSEDAA